MFTNISHNFSLQLLCSIDPLLSLAYPSVSLCKHLIHCAAFVCPIIFLYSFLLVLLMLWLSFAWSPEYTALLVHSANGKGVRERERESDRMNKEKQKENPLMSIKNLILKHSTGGCEALFMLPVKLQKKFQ